MTKEFDSMTFSELMQNPKPELCDYIIKLQSLIITLHNAVSSKRNGVAHTTTGADADDCIPESPEQPNDGEQSEPVSVSKMMEEAEKGAVSFKPRKRRGRPNK